MKKLAILIMFALPGMAFAVSQPHSIQDLAYILSDIINAGSSLMLTLLMVLFFGSLAWQTWKSKDSGSGFTERREIILWGLLIIFVVVSLPGIIRVLTASIFGPS